MKRKYFIPCLLAAAALGLSACSPESIGYAAIDNAQATDAHYEEIASYMDDYLENLGYFPMEYGVEWIGYYKYSDLYDIEEYEEMELGGYYNYSARLATGEIANADISTYWGENEDPVILNLTVETLDSENPIIPFNNDTIVACWEAYKQLAYPEDNPQ